MMKKRRKDSEIKINVDSSTVIIDINDFSGSSSFSLFNISTSSSAEWLIFFVFIS